MAVVLEEKKKYTYEDYCKLPEDTRYELIEGELVMSPAPKTKHQRIAGRLFMSLSEFVRKSKAGEVFISPCDVLDDENVVQPDILFISQERSGIIGEDNVKGAPDFVIEIVSDSTGFRDFVEKKILYGKYGVKEYWIVVPEDEAVEVFVRDEGKFVLRGRFEKGQKIEAAVLQGLIIKLSEIF